MKKSIGTIVGFLLFLFGALSFILDLVHVKLKIMYPIDALGLYWGLLVKMLMFIVGICLMYVLRMNKERI